ncbi:hypothetical protein [Rossellomorea sp. KS-H15a]|uniref:hypothetical protein n=1 Tax=Rossellomorea sp. KS-H15a TaxID=2963940 RepID=UPI0020C6B7B7|nr:hypothetical protein [Rossellomorea sp. KS-H15a]UTE78448.1 hypothetical protein M1J35_06690 [Rossellomorea sp. KS-H15a]
MFIYIAFALLLLNGGFMILKLVAPYSEMMNSFKTVNGFWKVQIACLALVLFFVFLHFSGENQAKWHTSPDFVSEGDLFLGDESGSVKYNSFIYEKKNYTTTLTLPYEAVDADKVRLVFSHKGKAKREPLVLARPKKEQPIELWFPESGQWRVDIEVNGSVYSSIVLPVKENN